MACVINDNKCTMSGFKGVAPLPNPKIIKHFNTFHFLGQYI